METAYDDRPAKPSRAPGYTPNLAGAIAILTEHEAWRGVLAFNDFTKAIVRMKTGPAGARTGREWTDEDDQETAAWLQDNFIPVGSKVASEAVSVVAHRNRYHPVRDYLESLHWDQEPRLDVWLTIYCGAEHSDYMAAVGEMWLRSAVARVYKPGCKVDHTLVLEGPQGIGKSQCLKILAGAWFSDDLQDFGSKDTAMSLPGHWIVELPEISAYTKYKGERLKAFLTRRADVYKPPYGRRVQHYPRQCVFAGSTDRATWLYDEEGNRRFWPVKCGRVDLWGLRRDRDQLWAEAVAQYKVGRKWWMDSLTDKRIIEAAAQEQKARFDYDCWGDLIDSYTRNRETVTVIEVLAAALHKQVGDCSQVDQNRVARHLRARGWRRVQTREKGGRKWVYACPGVSPV